MNSLKQYISAVIFASLLLQAGAPSWARARSLNDAQTNDLLAKAVPTQAILGIFAPSAPTTSATPTILAKRQARRSAMKVLLNATRVRSIRTGGARASEIDEAVTRSAVGKPLEVAAGVGQTMLFMLTIAGIEIVSQQFAKKGISVSAVTDAEMQNLAEQTALKIVNHGDVWMGIAGSGIANTVAKPALSVFHEIMASKESRLGFAKLLANSITKSVMFTGWEFGSQLWTEASLLLESEDDYKRTSNIFGMGAGAISALVMGETSNVSNQQDLRIVHSMFDNVMRVLFYDDDLTYQWLNNTLRTRLATGTFATLVGSMVVAGTAGSILFPGGGTLVGAMFGLAGAMASLLIPKWVKDKITSGLQGTLRKAGEMRLGTNAVEIRESLLSSNRYSIWPAEQRLELFSQTLRYRQRLRSESMTVAMDIAELNAKHFSEAKSNEARLAAAKEVVIAFLGVSKMLDQESREFARLQDIASKVHPPQSYVDALAEQVRRVTLLKDFFQSEAEDSADLLLEGVNQDYQFQTASTDLIALFTFVENGHNRGLREETIIKNWH